MFSLFLSLIILMVATSCSFKEQDDLTTPNKSTDPFVIDENSDSDGDFIKDIEEVQLGRNPFVGDMPEVRINFLQNYKIIVGHKNLVDGTTNEFVIDTKVYKDNPDFKYRVGDKFIRTQSYKKAGEIGKFSTHNWGDINEHDLSWVGYPELDPKFFLKQQLDFKKYFNKEESGITSIKIILENSIRLKEMGGFHSIKNLKLGFYYYDYEKENYLLLGQKLIKRQFNAGVNEIVEVELENVPLNLMSENFFKRGEFVISELMDFEIPELDRNYQSLLASVRAKSIPVVFNTPLEAQTFYVGLNGRKAHFAKILEILFPKKAVIEEDQLIKINQFENNLPDFTHLNEVKVQDKKGKWFILTNSISKHFLDFEYTSNDVISLSYLTGTELSDQSHEKILSYGVDVNSQGENGEFDLGPVSPNSQIDFQLLPKRRWGEKRIHGSDKVQSNANCGKNCYSYEFTCWFEFNHFEPYDNSPFNWSKDLDQDFRKLKIIINEDEFYLTDLIKEKKVSLSWQGEFIHISISNINVIKELQEHQANRLALKLPSFSEETFDGIKLVNLSGRDGGHCAHLTINYAFNTGTPISFESYDFNKWAPMVNWNVVKKGPNRTYHQNFSIELGAIINNKFN
jgi:hypothetical protein